MKERKRNPEKERANSKKSYEKLKIRLANDPEFAEEYREKKRIIKRKQIERIKRDPVKYKELKERQKAANIKYYTSNNGKAKICNKKRYEQLKEKLEDNPELKEKYLERQRNYYLQNQNKLKTNPDKLEEFKLKRELSQIKYKLNHPEKYKASYDKRNEEINKLRRVLNRMKTISIQDNKPIITERKPYPKRINPMQRKEDAYRDLQLRIINLERVITIDEIRIPKINDLRNEFIQQYGAMPI